MFNPLSNNFISLKTFETYLDNYEENFVLIENDFNKADIALLHLKSALDLMIQVHPLDAFQMIRILASRMMNNTFYSNNAFISIMEKAVQSGVADLILAIPYKLNQIDNDNPFIFDELWFNRVNYNKAIRSFFETYLTSDIHLLKTVNTNNLITVNEEKTLFTEDLSDSLITLRLGKDNLNVNLTAFQKQTIKLLPDISLDLPEDYDSNLPLTIKTYICIKAGIREFMLDKSVKFTDNCLSILSFFDYINKTSTINGNMKFTIPNHFYSYKLELVSYNSGDTWWVSNIFVVNP
jgi:hypothetical protein